MTDPIDSADPDEARPTGWFRIHLGAAAGVGKTCAMLDEGWRRFQRGTDVVVGYVETHKRPYTLEQLRDLPVIPRKRVEYRDTTWGEMDLVAVLERHPDVVLVDELAHTNVPGSGPHEKRWQDVLDILDAGIAVISTVNIQHVASLSDAVERITGVPIRERVPDWVVRRADQIELVDSSADQLRRRMVNGNIYPATQVHSALSGFFRTENLVALRELSLRFLADETEEQLLAFLLSRGHAAPGDVWDTAERILVALSGAPGSDAVIGRAARMAARMKADLLALHVVAGDSGRAAHTDQLEELVHDVGGTWQAVQGDDVAATIVQTAIEQQITQIVLGTSTPSRWPLTRRSVMTQVLRMASDAAIDVHVIAGANGRNAATTER
jgi:two-component system, OmpR family, sensor histidine kinase KdpD